MANNSTDYHRVPSIFRGFVPGRYGAASRAGSRPETALRIVLLAALYYATARLCQSIAVPAVGVMPVWFPSGVALAALLVFGYRVWPGIWLGSVLAGASWISVPTTGMLAWVAPVVVGTGATLQAMAGAYLTRRFISATHCPCNRADRFLKFVFLAGGVSCLVGTAFGITGLVLGHVLEWSALWPVELTWWLAETTGVVVAGSLLLTWYFLPLARWTPLKTAELLALLVLIVLLGQFAFGSLLANVHLRFAWAYATLAFLIWPAIRFGPRETTLAALMMSVVAILGYAGRSSALATGDIYLAVLSLQGMIGIATVTALTLAADVADRRRVTGHLDKYKTASLQTADHWMITDRDGTILEVNKSFESVTGYSQHEVVGKKANVLRSGKHNNEFYERMWRTLLSDEPYRGVVINRKKNGDLFHEMTTITPIKGQAGHSDRFLAIGKDITKFRVQEQELATLAWNIAQMNKKLIASETALSQQVDILNSLFGKIKEGIIVADESGNIVMFNEAAERMTGIQSTDSHPGEWSTKYDLYRTDAETKFPTGELPLRRAINGEMTDSSEMVVYDPEKSESRWLRASGSPISDEDGTIRGGLAVFRDVTDRRRAEKYETELRAARAELDIASKIQQRLLPEYPPKVDGLDIAGSTRPAAATGGDYYDFMTAPDGSLLIAVADVAGHGLGPALLMASVQGHLRALGQTGLKPDRILQIMNELIREATDPTTFVTFLLARLDPQSRVLDYVSAGHPTGYVLDHRGDIRKELMSTGLLLGAFPDLRPEISQPLQLEAGDIVVFLTDGILEAECKEGSFLGVDCTLELIRRHRDKPASEIVRALFTEVIQSGGDANLEDDITAVVIKATG